MDAAAIHERLKARFEAGVGDCDLKAKDPFIAVEPAAIVDVCRFLHDEPDLRFDSLSNQSGVDYKAKGIIQVVYHLYSYPHRHKIVLKVDTPRDNPVVPTVEGVWKAANWLEREIYDLLGVTFEGHSRPAPAAHAGGLDRPSAAQGFRRAGRVSRHQHPPRKPAALSRREGIT